MRKPIMGISAAVMFAAVAILGAPSAVAANTTQPAPKVTGSVFLDPAQYLSLNAFAETAQSPMKGSVTYANYTYSCPGSGAWAMSASPTVWFIALGAYNWDFAVTPGQWTGGSYTFSGTAAAEFDGLGRRR